MNRVLGDYVFIRPIERDGNQWSGNIVDRGAKVITFSTYYECDLVVYNDIDIVETLVYEGVTVHKLWYQNITKN